MKKLNFSEDFQPRNKKVGVITVRQYVKSTDWGKKKYLNVSFYTVKK